MNLNIRVDHFVHFDLAPGVDAKLDEINRKLDALFEQEARVTPELQRLQQSVSDETSVIQSAVTLIGGLADQIRALKDDPAALAALADSVDASKQQLAAAVTQNTVAPA